ncbi:helix-turn-helix domain-containing protein [Brevundimonas sp. M-11_2]
MMVHALPFAVAPRPALRPYGDIDVRLTYGADEPIYVEGDEATFVYVLLSGAVRTIRHSLEGRRQIGGFYYPGDLFGLEPGAHHRFSAEALGPSEAVAFGRGAQWSALHQHTLTQAALLELARTQDHLAMLGRRTAREKIASFLLDVAARSATENTALLMSRQDIADYLGLAIETVSRALGQFQNDGWVAFSSCREFHILKRSSLERLASR